MTKMKQDLIQDCFKQMERINKRFDHYMWDETKVTHIREIDRRLKALSEFMDLFLVLHPDYKDDTE